MFSVLGPRYGDIHGCRGDKENSYLDNLDGSFLEFFFPFPKKNNLIHEKFGLTG